MTEEEILAGAQSVARSAKRMIVLCMVLAAVVAGVTIIDQNIKRELLAAADRAGKLLEDAEKLVREVRRNGTAEEAGCGQSGSCTGQRHASP